MIVDEDHVAAALAYLGDDTSAAKRYYDATTAKNFADLTYAQRFLENAGSVAERDARAIADPEYQEALQHAAKAESLLEAHKAKVQSCKMICEIFRTENANARAAERIR